MKRHEIGWYLNLIIGAIFLSGDWILLRFIGAGMFLLSFFVLFLIEQDSFKRKK